MQKAIDILKGKNIKLTHQRVEVYKFFKDGCGHLSAEEIYEKVKTKIPTISLATVYTILDLFKQKGLIAELKIRSDKSCFDARIDSHHHFLCRKCENIFDIDIPLCSTLENKEVNGHHIESARGYFYGTCKNCLGGEGVKKLCC